MSDSDQDRPCNGVEFELLYTVSVERLWDALTREIADWWPAEFYCHDAGGAASRQMRLEPWPGGRLWEDWGEQGGLLWAQVLQVTPRQRLELSGTLSPAFGGPAVWCTSFQFDVVSDCARLRFADCGTGRLSEELLEHKERGWRFLLDGALRAWCEGEDPPSFTEPAGGR
jgi:uncharacterized protein YndB with AHSA1/START domain